MALCAAVAGIQILLLGFTLPALVSTVIICGLVNMAMKAAEKEANEALLRLTTSLTDWVLPELEQQAESLQKYTTETFSDVSRALSRLKKCRSVLDKIPDRAPKEIKLALKGITLMQNEMSQSLIESKVLGIKHEHLVKSLEMTKKELKRAKISQWQDEHLLKVIRRRDNSSTR